jgi:hypothetical protein
MSYDIDDPKDFKNLIKACPHCGEVWVKVEGCDFQTTCGARVSDSYKKDKNY